MRKNDMLFQLVRTMTRSEKRYFKVANTISSDKDYMRLFDAIDAQGVYNEDALRKKFKGEPYFNQLSAVKLYLYRQIIESLNSYHREASVNIQLNRYLTEVEVLYRKGLFKNSFVCLKKAKALAIKFEKWTELLRLTYWEVKLVYATYDKDDIDVVVNRCQLEREQILRKYTEGTQLSRLFREALSFFEIKGYARTEQEKQKIELMLSHEILRQEAHSFDAELTRLGIISTCNLVLGRHELRFEGIKKGVEHFQRNPLWIKEYLGLYFNNLRELANISLSLKKITYAESVMKLMTEIHNTHYNQLSVTAKILYLDFEIALLFSKGRFKDSLECMDKIKMLRADYSATLQPLDHLYLNDMSFQIYFRNKDYRQTEYYIQQIMSNSPNIRWDVNSMVRVANLIVQYEQKQYEHLGYVLRSTYRYMLSKKMLEKPEQIILKFIRNSAKLHSEKEILHALAELKEQFLPYKDDSFFFSFPFIEWIDSKLQNRELAEVVRENYLNALSSEPTA